MSWHRPWVGTTDPAPSRRLVPWLALALALAVCLAYALVWQQWVSFNTHRKYAQQPPGATALWDGANFGVVSLKVVTAVDTTGEGPLEAIEGAAWVEAEVHVSTEYSVGLSNVQGACQLNLLGPNGAVWEPVNRFDDRPDACTDSTTQKTATIFLTYLVPDAAAAQLYGLVVPTASVIEPVIRP